MTHPTLGVCYYPEHWPDNMWADDAAKMSALGFTWVRIGEFAWSKIEPKEGEFHWNWLDRAIQTLGDAGLKVILGTPTATPPRWMLDKHSDMLAVDETGQPRKFGSRRHYCFSHEGYRTECARITRKLAERYGPNLYVHAWQTDNEYGCHETVLSYSQAATQSFRNWLARKYPSIDALNEAWGNVFWSMTYADFEDIDLPNQTVTEPNPAHMLDFRRFSSDQVKTFNIIQTDILKALSDKPLIHNYMGGVTDFNHFDIGQSLDIASWDSYPLGFLEDRVEADDARRAHYMRQGDPDYQAFHHDLYRAVGRGRWGVMEQQPGPVNWAPYNPAPLPGMVRLWTWEAVAHGAEFVNYFRWRQLRFGQEQMHAGLLRTDNIPGPYFDEIKQTAQELKTIEPPPQAQAPVGIIFDYESVWAWETQPQGESFDYAQLIFEIYHTLRKLGVSIDIIPANSRVLNSYKCLIIPGLFSWPPGLRRALISYRGHLLIGPRTGSKTPDFQIPLVLPPDIPGFNVTVTHVESLRPGASVPLVGGGHIHKWREFLETNAMIEERCTDGTKVMVSSDKVHYLGGWPDPEAMNRILSELLTRAGVETLDLPAGLRVRDFGNYRLFMNYGAAAVIVPHTMHTLKIPPAGILLIDRHSHKVLVQ